MSKVQQCHLKFHKIKFEHDKRHREALRGIGNKVELRISLYDGTECLDKVVTDAWDRRRDIDFNTVCTLWEGLDKSFVECKRFEIKISVVFYEKRKVNEEKPFTFYIPLAALELNTTCSHTFRKENREFGGIEMPVDFQLVDQIYDPTKKVKNLEPGYFDPSWTLDDTVSEFGDHPNSGDIDVSNTVAEMYSFASRYNIPEELLVSWDFIRNVVQMSMHAEKSAGSDENYRSTAPIVSIQSITRSHLLTQTVTAAGISSNSETVGWKSSVPYQVNLLDEI